VKKIGKKLGKGGKQHIKATIARQSRFHIREGLDGLLLLYAAFWCKAAQVGMEDGGISFPPNEVCHGVNSATRMWHSCTESVTHEIFDWLQDIMLLVATILRIHT